MAAEYFLYSTLYNNTLVNRSNSSFTPLPPDTGEIYVDYFIPIIQPLYYYRESGATILLNDEETINEYLNGTAPPPEPNDNATIGYVTGKTKNYIPIVPTTQENNVSIFNIDGTIKDSGINISGTTGTTVVWGEILGLLSNQTDLKSILDSKLQRDLFNYWSGTTLPANYYNKTEINNNNYTKSEINSYSAQTLTNINSRLLTTDFNLYSGTTATLINTKIDKVTGAVGDDIATFVSGGNVQDSGKQFIATVNPVATAENAKVPTELAVRNAINQAVSSAMILQGDWDADTNTPDLTVVGITTGFAWRVSVSGSTNLGGISGWHVGDVAVKSATGWIKIANKDVAAVWGNVYGVLSDQTDLQDALNLKANLSSPALTNVPTAPTAAQDTDTTQLATTSFVLGQAGTVSPLMNGSVSVGTSERYSRQDHIHPHDNSKVNVSGGSTICGSLTATTSLYMQTPSSGGTLSDYYVRWNPDTGELRTIPPTSDQRIYCYSDRRTTQSNSTTTNATYLTNSWTLSAGHYESEFNAIYGNTSSNRCAVVCFLVDGTVVGSCNLMKTNASTVQTTAYITQNENLSAGTHTISMVFNQLGGGTANMYYGAMRVQRISDCI